MSRHVLRPALKNWMHRSDLVGDAGWIPTDDANLQIWYDFSDPNYMFTDVPRTTNVSTDGDLIYATTDKASSPDPFIYQSSDGFKFIYKVNQQNGRSAAFLDSVAVCLADSFVSIGTSYIYWGAIKPEQTGAGVLHFQFGTNCNSGYSQTFGTFFFRAGGTNRSATAPNNTWFRFIVHQDAVTPATNIYINGSLLNSLSAGTTTWPTSNLYWGATNINGNPFQGYIGEIGVYSGAPAAGLLDNIDAYLASRWA